MADKIEQAIIKWGEELVTDMREAIEKVVRFKDGSGSDLSKSVDYNIKKFDTHYQFTLSMNEYWRYLDKGRGPSRTDKGNLVYKAFNKGEWYAKKGISPSDKLMQIQIEYYKRKGLKRTVKRLPYDQAKKSLSAIYASKIHQHGYKAKPFYNSVINPERIDKLKKLLSVAFKEDFIIDIKQSI